MVVIVVVIIIIAIAIVIIINIIIISSSSNFSGRRSSKSSSEVVVIAAVRVVLAVIVAVLLILLNFLLRNVSIIYCNVSLVSNHSTNVKNEREITCTSETVINNTNMTLIGDGCQEENNFGNVLETMPSFTFHNSWYLIVLLSVSKSQ